MKTLGIIAGLLISGTTFASGLSGTYRVVAQSGCNLQGDTVERVEATPTGLSLTLEGYGNPDFDKWFSATIGDIITRPSDFDIAHGYTDVLREISSYSGDSDYFKFAQYLYDRSVSDEAGLGQTPFKIIELKATGSGSILYKLTYRNGETYRCELQPSL